MITTRLEFNINTLRDYAIRMVEKCEESVSLSVKSLVDKDVDLAKKVIKLDEDIDTLREYIRDRTIELMVLKQPVAKDLRFVYALSNIAIELERIGDYAENIAEETVVIGDSEHIMDLEPIVSMSNVCLDMLKDVKTALINCDDKLAYDIAMRDDKIDKIYEESRPVLVDIMREDSNNVDQGTRFLFIARYLERIGDHITNICEKVVYVSNGQMIEIG
ncbi:MAG: phosphate signaling complex protein PhoU [Peptostreptococcaceae bacterium]